MPMNVSGSLIINRTPDDLWNLLLDPRVLRRCLPGCEELEPDGIDSFRVKIKVGLGLIKGRFKGSVKLLDVQPSQSYRLEVRARGTTGFVDGGSSIRLRPVEGGTKTELHYEGEARVGGVVATMGARLFQGAAQSFADDFFRSLREM